MKQHLATFKYYVKKTDGTRSKDIANAKEEDKVKMYITKEGERIENMRDAIEAANIDK